MSKIRTAKNQKSSNFSLKNKLNVPSSIDYTASLPTVLEYANSYNAADYMPPEVVWTRNTRWRTMPTVLDTEEKIVILTAIYPNNAYNYFSFYMTGAYEIDWNESGSFTQYTSGSVSSNQITFASVANTDTVFSITASTCTFTLTNHGYIDGDEISFGWIDSTTGITANTKYYVIQSTANTFKLSATFNGDPLTLATDGTAYLDGYKQVFITIRPQSGSNLTNVQLNRRHASMPATTKASSNFLDITMSIPYATTLVFTGSNNGSKSSTYMVHDVLEKLTVLKTSTITASYTFSNLDRLKSLSVNLTNINCAGLCRHNYSLVEFIPLANGVCNGTDGGSMFLNCVSLKKVGMFDTSNFTTMTYFIADTGIEYLPPFDFSSASVCHLAFRDNWNLKYVDDITFGSTTTGSQMFYNCPNLVRVPPSINVNGIADLTEMFRGCHSLKYSPILTNTNSLVTTTSMYLDCKELEYVPLYFTGNVKTANSMFNNCSSLTQLPNFNFTSLNSSSSMFNAVSNVVDLSNLTFSSSLNDASNMFLSCSSLKTPPFFDARGLTNTTSMFESCSALEQIPEYNFSSVTNATATFNNCYSLKEVPNLNLVNATNLTGLVANCNSLKKIDSGNFGPKITTATSIFSSCPALEEIPYIDLSKCTASLSYLIYYCGALKKVDLSLFSTVNQTVIISNNSFSASDLNTIYTYLPTVSAKTITVTGNWGVDADTTSIATAKGWTVSG